MTIPPKGRRPVDRSSDSLLYSMDTPPPQIPRGLRLQKHEVIPGELVEKQLAAGAVRCSSPPPAVPCEPEERDIFESPIITYCKRKLNECAAETIGDKDKWREGYVAALISLLFENYGMDCTLVPAHYRFDKYKPEPG